MYYYSQDIDCSQTHVHCVWRGKSSYRQKMSLSLLMCSAGCTCTRPFHRAHYILRQIYKTQTGLADKRVCGQNVSSWPVRVHPTHLQTRPLWVCGLKQTFLADSDRTDKDRHTGQITVFFPFEAAYVIRLFTSCFQTLHSPQAASSSKTTPWLNSDIFNEAQVWWKGGTSWRHSRGTSWRLRKTWWRLAVSGNEWQWPHPSMDGGDPGWGGGVGEVPDQAVKTRGWCLRSALGALLPLRMTKIVRHKYT